MVTFVNVAPMTSRIADADKYRLVFAFCFFEGFIDPDRSLGEDQIICTYYNLSPKCNLLLKELRQILRILKIFRSFFFKF